MTNHAPRLILLLFVLFAQFSFSQQFRIVEASTQEGIPFAKVKFENGVALLTDIDGFFSWPNNLDSITVSSPGYLTVSTANKQKPQIELEALDRALEEITVLPENEEGKRVMRLAAAQRKNNHPFGNQTWRNTTYSKCVFSVNQEALAAIPDTTSDTSLLKIKEFFNTKHLFIIESTTEHFFKPPHREKERILSYKASGLNNPLLSTFATEIQTFHFYDNQFNLFGQNYLSPMVYSAETRYYFFLEETTINPSGDTTFTIRFRPKKSIQELGLKGMIYINSNGYAIEKISAQPVVQNETVTAKIIQEYIRVDGHWFPYKLSTEGSLPGTELSNNYPELYITLKGNTYVDSIQFNVDVSDQQFRTAPVETADNADKVDEQSWQNARKIPLTEKEQNTYIQIDSISKAIKLDNKFNALNALISGKIPIGPIQLDIDRFYNFRSYEGNRFGLGITSNQQKWQRFSIGGYGAWGSYDKEWKYGGTIKVRLKKATDTWLSADFQDDIIERGGIPQAAKPVYAFNPDEATRQLYVSEMDRQRLARLTYSTFPWSSVNVKLALNYMQMGPRLGYRFKDSVTSFQQFSYIVDFDWKIREKVMILGNQRITTPSNFPRIRFQFSSGVSGFAASQFDYWRFVAQIDENLLLPTVGKLQFKMLYNYNNGSVPLLFSGNLPGTSGRWNISVPNSFETIHSSTYYSDHFGAFFFRFTTRTLIKKWKKFSAPSLGVHYAIASGQQRAVTLDKYSLPVWNGLYQEVGLLIPNLLVTSTSGIGLGIFQPIGTYDHDPYPQKLTLKLVIGIRLK